LQDIQKLIDICKSADQFFKSKENTLSKPQEIAAAIVKQTLLLASDGVSIRDLIFNYQDVHDLVWTGKVSSDDARVKVNRHSANLLSTFSDESELQEFLISQGHDSVLRLEINATSGGQKTTMGLQILSLEDSEEMATQEKNSIEYVAVQMPKVYFFAKPLLELHLKPWPVVLMGLVSLTISLVGVLSILGILRWGNEYLYWLFILASFPSAYIVLKFKELLDKGVTDMPFLMSPVLTKNAMLVLHKERHDSNVKLKMKTAVYECSCAICGENILIEKSREFHGRYVGKCTVAPTEHVYSFDHTTKKGNYLR